METLTRLASDVASSSAPVGSETAALSNQYILLREFPQPTPRTTLAGLFRARRMPGSINSPEFFPAIAACAAENRLKGLRERSRITVLPEHWRNKRRLQALVLGCNWQAKKYSY